MSAYEHHLRRLERRRWDVEYQEKAVAEACAELLRRRQELADEEKWTSKQKEGE